MFNGLSRNLNYDNTVSLFLEPESDFSEFLSIFYKSYYIGYYKISFFYNFSTDKTEFFF